MKKPKYTPEQQELVRAASEILKKVNWTPLISKAHHAPDNGMKCTCRGMQPDPDCSLHRMIG